MVRAGFEDIDGLGSEEVEGDADFALENEAGLAEEIEGLREDLGAETGVEAGLGVQETSRRRTRSQTNSQGGGFLRLVDEKGRPFPGIYNNPLLDLYSQDDPPPIYSAPKVRKRNHAQSNQFSSSETRDSFQGSSADPETPGRRDSAGSNKSVRFENAEQATPMTVRESDDEDDEDDGDFEPDEVDESDKENADPQAKGKDPSGNDIGGSDTSSSTFSEFNSSDSDVTSSSGLSSSDTDTDSDSKQQPSSDPEELHNSASPLQEDASETSSSATSSSSNGSETEAEDNAEKFRISLNTSVEGIEYTPLKKPQPKKPPGTGRRDTRKRNQRRKNSKALKKLINKGDLPANATKEDLQNFRDARKAPAAQISNQAPNILNISNVQAAKFEGKQHALLDSNISERVAVKKPSQDAPAASGQQGESSVALADKDSPTAAKDKRSPGIAVATNSQEQEQPFPAVQIQDSNHQQAFVQATESTKDAVPKLAKQQVEEMDHDAFGVKEIAKTQDSIGSTDKRASTTAESEVRRSSLDLASSRRLLFGSLGLRVPKSEEDALNVQAKLMKNAKPGTQTYADVEAGKQLAIADDESWKDKIDLRAVECCYEGIELSRPSFPFVQRWDPQQQLGYRPNNSRQRAKAKKRKRNDSSYYENQYNKYFNGEIQNHSQQRQDNELPASQPEFEPENPAEGDDTEEGKSMFTHSSQDAQAASNQLVRETFANADTGGAAPEDTQIPALPADLSTSATLTREDCKPGAVIAFKKFEMSMANGWQPYISDHRTAVVDYVLDDGTLEMTWAKRDQPDPQKRYDNETGERVYGKFEMPGYDDEEEDSDPSKVSIVFTELIEPKLIRAARDSSIACYPGRVECSSSSRDAPEAAHDRSNNQIQDEGQDQKSIPVQDKSRGEKIQDLDSSKCNAFSGDRFDSPVGPLQQGLDGAQDDNVDVSMAKQPNNTQVKQEMSEIFRDAGWRSSLGSDVNQKLCMLEGLASENDIDNKEGQPLFNAPFPKFDGFPNPASLRYSEMSSPVNDSPPKTRSSNDEITESIPVPDTDKAGLSLSSMEASVVVEYPSLPHLDEDSETLHNQRQHRSLSNEGNYSSPSSELISPPSLRRKKQQPSPQSSPRLRKEREPKENSALDGAESDSDEFPTLFSQAFDSRLSQEMDTKHEPSRSSSTSPLPTRKSKSKSKSKTKATSLQRSEASSTRNRTSSWPCGDADESMITMYLSQPSHVQQSSEIVDLTSPSEAIVPDDTLNDGDDSYRPSSSLPTGSGWVAKAVGRKGNGAKVAGRKRKTASR